MTAARPSEVLARVEQELRDLWSAIPAPGEAPKIRVTTMNLVVVGSPEVTARYVSVVDEVTKNIPARAVLLSLSPEGRDARLEADVSAVCSLDGDRRTTCSERIRLWAEGSLSDRMASAVAGLLEPELPTALVWLGRVRVDDGVFLGLAGESARVLLDTEYTSVQSLVHLVQWAGAASGRPPVADLSWTRLGAWRELAARFFDEGPMLPFASHVRRVRVLQAGEGTVVGSQAALFVGWLGSRLGWRTRVIGGALRVEDAEGTAIDVRFGSVPRPAGVAPLALAAVEVEARWDGRSLIGSITRDLASGVAKAAPDADTLLWTRRLDEGPSVERRVRLGANKGARLLEMTLHRPASDPTLVDAARFADRILDPPLPFATAAGDAP